MLPLKGCVRAAAVLTFALLTGCIAPTPFVDTTIHDLSPQEKVHVANPQPVQMVFEFQTKGVANDRVTTMLKDTVQDSVQTSGLFDHVGDAPAPNGALLHVTINNVPLTDDAFAKGFATGFTLGLVGSTVADGYVCTIDYIAAPNAKPITKTMRDAIYANIGATAKQPDHSEKEPDFTTAAKVMAHKIVGNALNELAKDPDFGK
jgi:hypothetical protein